MKLRTLVAEDEPLARKKIHELLLQEPDIEWIGECDNGLDALAAIREHKPDLVFLDVKMPEMDGFTVIKHLQHLVPRAVVFFTAYNQFAVKAFEVNAVDYLLKPFDAIRINQCLTKV